MEPYPLDDLRRGVLVGAHGGGLEASRDFTGLAPAAVTDQAGSQKIVRYNRAALLHGFCCPAAFVWLRRWLHALGGRLKWVFNFAA